MNVFDSQTKTPISALTRAAEEFSQPQLRRHELWAVTCYFRPNALRILVSELRFRIKLTDIYVLYNYTEDFRYPELADEMEKLIAELLDKKINLDFRRIRPESGLFHSKGYALIQKDGQAGDMRDKYLLITSGNLTDQGLGITKATSNLELSYASNKKKDVQAFVDIVNSIWNNPKLQSNSKNNHGLSDFEIYTNLLLQAVYLCKWEGSLRQELSAIFRVAEESIGMISVPNPLLIEMNFDIEKKSLGRYYFNDRPPKPLPKYFLRDYTVSTLIGNWCPLSVWDVVKNTHKNKFDDFKKWIFDATSESALKAIDKKCQLDLAKLKEGGIKIDGDPMESLRSRIKNLVKNDIKIWRLYCQYENFQLRYDLEDIDGINELFGSLEETVKSKGKKNLIMRKVVEVLNRRDIEKINLTEKQIDILTNYLNEEVIDEEDEDAI